MWRIKALTLIVIVSLAALALPSPAGAFPPLPSSFYGTVRVNGQNIADGTLVEALIAGVVYARATTMTYQGGTVYALDVPGDDTDTAATDGGRPGDTITFRVGSALAGQTATWSGGSNQELDLTVTSSTPLSTPQASPTPPPTQTPLVDAPPGEGSPATATQSQPGAEPTQAPAEDSTTPDPTGDVQLTSSPQPGEDAGQSIPAVLNETATAIPTITPLPGTPETPVAAPVEEAQPKSYATLALVGGVIAILFLVWMVIWKAYTREKSGSIQP
jgi:hypothetical protein